MVQGQSPRPGRLSGAGGLWLAGVAGGAHALALAWPWPHWAVAGAAFGEPWPLLQWLALLVLAALCRHAPGWRQAALRAGCFGTAWLAGTFWWLYVSMHVYGELPAWMAAFSVLALAAFLALYTAAVGALVWRWRHARPAVFAGAFAALWLLAEWARGRWLTGFPWGAAGYAHVESLAAWAPWIGVYGMGAWSAGLAAWAAAALAARAWRAGLVIALALIPIAAPSVGLGLAERMPRFTQAVGLLPVVLLQGNIAQDQKFEPGLGVPQALQWYLAQTEQALPRLDAQGGGLVVAPETAIPVLPQDVDPAWWAQWQQAVARSRSAVLVGMPLGSLSAGYTNSVVAWTPTGSTYRYDKHHLVPFGEFVPPFFRWFTEWMQIPMGDFERGPLAQPPFEWAGQRIAPHICYEDLFGEELAASFRGADRAPTVLLNVSNIAWFGDTVAIDQHRQIARLRALEFQRPMVRATNTGSTAVIDAMGRVQAEWPRLSAGALEATVEGRSGLTPYAHWVGRWGLWPLVGLALALLWGLWPQASPRPRH
jgi:apolipoprotein N-acyltransferase